MGHAPRLTGVMVTVLLCACRSGPDERMSFFVTSVHAGAGGDIGGLVAADAHCQRLAESVGSTKRQWRAYLSAGPQAASAPVHARDRIGQGPWFNVNGVQIAGTLAELHSPQNALRRRTSLNERGQPTAHDIMTGSNADGTFAGDDATCRNWTSTSSKAMVGHSDKEGQCCGDAARSWNSAHLSAGCTLAGLREMGGAGLFYCFAAD
jgi:hypothetical protein